MSSPPSPMWTSCLITSATRRSRTDVLAVWIAVAAASSHEVAARAHDIDYPVDAHCHAPHLARADESRSWDSTGERLGGHWIDLRILLIKSQWEGETLDLICSGLRLTRRR